MQTTGELKHQITWDSLFEKFADLTLISDLLPGVANTGRT